MKLTTQTQVTVDGVMQGNGGATDEDRRNGFERGGWAMGAGDAETRRFITETYQRADAFLFGRRTYDIFASYWGAKDRGSHPIADALNTTPKYLASTTITDTYTPLFAAFFSGTGAAADNTLSVPLRGYASVRVQ